MDSLLERNCIIPQSTLFLTDDVSLTLASSNQECYYLLQINKQYVELTFGEGLTLLRKLIISKVD